MKHNRWFRSLVCLLVVCALIVNISPIRAEAFALEATAVAGIGALALLLLAYAGVVYVPESAEAFVVYGNSLINYLKEWGEKNDQSEIVGWWIQQVNVDLTGGGGKAPLHVPPIMVLAIIEWIRDLINGDASVEIEDEIAPEGYAYFNGYLLPSIKGLNGWDANFRHAFIIYQDSSSNEIKLVSNVGGWPFIYNSNLKFDYVTSSYQYVYYYTLVDGVWSYQSHDRSLSDISTGISFDSILWNYTDIYDAKSSIAANNTKVLLARNNFTSSYSGELKYNALLGEVAPGIQEGTHTAEDIEIPNYVDMSQIFDYSDSSPSDSVIDAMGDLASGDLSYSDYQDMFPMAAVPDVYIDLSTEAVTYEQGATTRPLIVNASAPDGGVLSYQWYMVNSNDFMDTLIEGAIGPKYIPKSDALGTFQYYCHITNVLQSGATADIYTKTATIEIVAPGTVAPPDVSTDPVTNTGLKGMLSDIGVWLSGLLDAVLSIPQAILDGIVGLFVPSVDALAVQQNKWQQLLAERFGIMYEAGDLILGIGEEFSGITVKDTITLPTITLPLGEVDWTIGGWTVDVVPDGFEFLIDTLKLIINVLCTFAFIGAMRRRFDRMMEG